MKFVTMEYAQYKMKINNNNGNYDLNKQKEIANKYRKIEEIKKNISNQIDILCSTEIQLQ